MKNLKKVLALVLVFAMAFTTFASAAFTDQNDIDAANAEAVEMLAALGVIKGYEDGSYKPEATVTRAEMAKMLYFARTGSDNASTYANVPTTFTDIRDSWAASYIKYCQTNGIIAGKSATQFDPEATVTGVEAAKMMLVTIGYDAKNAVLTGPNWAQNTLSLASECNLLDDVKDDLGSALTRQGAAQMLYNMLFAYRVKWSTDSGSFDYMMNSAGATETVGEKFLNLYLERGVLYDIDGTTLRITNSKGSYGFTKVNTDYSDLMGQMVKVLYTSNTDKTQVRVLGVYAVPDNKVHTTYVNNIEKDDRKIKFGGTSYSMDNDRLEVFRDGASASRITSSTFDQTAYKISPDAITLIDTDDNGKLDTAVISTLKVAKVTYVSSDSITAGGTTYKYADENIADGLARNDWVIIKENLYDQCKDITKADMMTGVEITGTKPASGTDPEKYLLDDDQWVKVGNKAELNNVKVGNTVDAVVVNGILFYAKRTSGTSAAGYPDDVVFVSYADPGAKTARLVWLNGSAKRVDYTLGDGTSMAMGRFYEASESSDGSYELTKLDTATEAYGDYTVGNNNNGVAINTAGGKGNYKVDTNVRIADSARVVLYVDRGADLYDTEVITGKQFQTMNASEIIAGTNNYYMTAKIDGLNQAGVLSVVVSSTNNGGANFETDDNYAYITDTAYKSASNYVTYKIWNGTEEVTVTEKRNTTSGRSKGTVIGYSSVDANGEISDVSAKSPLKGAISGFTSSKVSFDGVGQYDLTTDTVILTVDTDDHKGVASTDLVEADDVNGVYIENAMYIISGGDVALIVVDSRNQLENRSSMTVSVSGVSGTFNTTSGKSGDMVAFSATATGTATLTNGVFVQNGSNVMDVNAGNSYDVIIGNKH